MPSHKIVSHRFTFLGLIAIFALNPFTSLQAEEFAELRAIKGVITVEYAAPFLLVKVKNTRRRREISEQIRKVVDENLDPDVAAIQKPFRLRIYEKGMYDEHQQIQKLASNIKSSEEFYELYRLTKNVTLIHLDWTKDYPFLSQDSYMRGNLHSVASSSRHADPYPEAVHNYVDQLKKTNHRPEKLLYMFSKIGDLIFPVFDGKIRIRQETFSYEAFTSMLKSRDKIGDPIIINRKTPN